MANSQRRQKQQLVILPAVGPDLAPLTTKDGLYRCQLLEFDAPNIESRYLDLSELKGSNVATQDSYKGSAVQRDICRLCSEFSRDLQLSDYGESEAHSLVHWEPLSATEPHLGPSSHRTSTPFSKSFGGMILHCLSKFVHVVG